LLSKSADDPNKDFWPLFYRKAPCPDEEHIILTKAAPGAKLITPRRRCGERNWINTINDTDHRVGRDAGTAQQILNLS
jgi:hypothetical protein